jgi:hypothetical protein
MDQLPKRVGMSSGALSLAEVEREDRYGALRHP